MGWYLFWGVVLFQIIIVYYRQARADTCIIGFIFTTYFLKIFPDIQDLKLFQWNYSRFADVKEKLKLVSAVELEKKDKRAKNKGQSGLCSTEEKDNNVEQYNSVEKIPAEIWRRILNKLNDRKDVISCYYTCMLFRNLLDIRVQAEALLVLDNYLREKSEIWHLQKDEILKCRLISTSWKLSVDHFLQHHPSQMHFSEHLCIPYTVIDSSKPDHVEGLIERLIERYHHGNPNPFPSRHLKLRITSDLTEDDCKIFLAATSILFKYYGAFVWYITLHMCVDEKDAASTYQAAYNLLAQVPNVKMVNLRFLDKLNKQQTRHETKEFVLSNPFPAMKLCTAVKFDDVPETIINSALMANKQIEKLTVTSSDDLGNLKIEFHGSSKDLPETTELYCLNLEK